MAQALMQGSDGMTLRSGIIPWLSDMFFWEYTFTTLLGGNLEK